VHRVELVLASCENGVGPLQVLLGSRNPALIDQQPAQLLFDQCAVDAVVGGSGLRFGQCRLELGHRAGDIVEQARQQHRMRMALTREFGRLPGMKAGHDLERTLQQGRRFVMPALLVPQDGEVFQRSRFER
jgi:hypothetical protein